jgi:hypothetical protein
MDLLFIHSITQPRASWLAPVPRRVNSWLWVLDQFEPESRTIRADAIRLLQMPSLKDKPLPMCTITIPKTAFSMSCIDEFCFRNDVQRCRDHVKNAMDWLLNIKQPMIRSALRQLQPIAKNWKRGRVASVAADPDPSEQFDSESQRSVKSMRVL